MPFTPQFDNMHTLMNYYEKIEIKMYCEQYPYFMWLGKNMMSKMHFCFIDMSMGNEVEPENQVIDFVRPKIWFLKCEPKN